MIELQFAKEIKLKFQIGPNGNSFESAFFSDLMFSFKFQRDSPLQLKVTQIKSFQ